MLTVTGGRGRGKGRRARPPAGWGGGGREGEAGAVRRHLAPAAESWPPAAPPRPARQRRCPPGHLPVPGGSRMPHCFPVAVACRWLAAPQQSDSRRPSRHLPRLQLAVAGQAGDCRPSARVVVELRGRLAPPLPWRAKTEASSQPLRLGSLGSSATAAHPGRDKTGSYAALS